MLGQIDWSGASMHDRAAAMDYVAHRVEGRVTQDMQAAMREQAMAGEAGRRFEKFKNRDTGNLETVVDNEGNIFYLAGGTLEAGQDGTADGVVFVTDPETGETSQRSVDELRRGGITTPEQYEEEFRQRLEAVSEAEAEAAALEEIVEEATAAGEDHTPRVAEYMGIDLNGLAGQTVTLADGGQAYIDRVYQNLESGFMEIDAVPVDPATGLLRTNEKGEEAHYLLDVRSIVPPKQQAQEVKPVKRNAQQAQGTAGMENAATSEETTVAPESVAQAQPVPGNMQEVTRTVPEQNPAQGGAADGTPGGTQKTGLNADTGNMPTQESAETTGEQTLSDPRIGRSLSPQEAEEMIRQMEAAAEDAPELELTPENWLAEFGENGMVDTPIGQVKMGENQLAKMFMKGRNAQLGMVKPTLTTPDAIVEVESEANNGQAERPSSLLFIKTFLDKSGEKHTYFTSVTVQRDGMEVAISNHIEGEKRIRKFLEKGKLLYRVYGGAQTEQNRVSVSGTTPPVDPGVVNKGTNSVPSTQEISRKKDGTTDYDRIDDPATVASAMHEEFGEEAEQVARECLDEARQELEKAGTVKRAIDRDALRSRPEKRWTSGSR